MALDLEQLERASGHAVSRETIQRLDRFEQAFRKWQARINLVAPSTLQDLELRHIADSLQVLAIKPHALRIIDLGSGGGFPGLILALALADRSDAHVDLIESNNKKAGFLRTMLRECGGTGTVHAERIERTIGRLPTPDLVTARALAPLVDLIGLAEPALRAGATGLFHKGRDFQAEIEKARGMWRFDLVVHPSRVDPDSVLLELAGVKPA